MVKSLLSWAAGTQLVGGERGFLADWLATDEIAFWPPLPAGENNESVCDLTDNKLEIK